MNIVSYFISGIAYLSKATAISTGIYLVVIAGIGIACDRKRLTENLFYVKHYIFCTYIITAGFITGILQGHWEMNLSGFAFQIVPFKNMDFSQMLLNVLLFIPLGVQLPILSRKLNSCFKVMGISALATLSTEVIQAVFKGRLADVDDVIANIIGALAGYLIYKIAYAFISKHKHRETGVGSLSLFWSCAACMFSLSYSGISVADVFLYNWGFDTMQGVPFSEMFTAGLALIGYCIGRRYPEDFLALAGRTLAVLAVFLSLIGAVG